MTFTNRLPQIKSQLQQGQHNGLVGIGDFLVEKISERLAQGFTSGAFVEGELAKSVRRSEPVVEADGASIQVGTDQLRALMWEAGHLNVFTRKYERVEVWIPTAVNTRDEQMRRYRDAIERALK